MHRLWTDMGIAASTDDCFLGLRGLRTLAVRMARHQENALTVASWLRRRPEVADVLYPALADAPGHALFKRDFASASGLFSIVLKPVARERVNAMLNGLALFGMGWSWGGFESLIIPTYPERTRAVTKWKAAGPCLRLAVGLDDPHDLIADLENGFRALAG